MALDKQKILSELGSVMNQLKSADCGCMGKLFGNTTSCAPNVPNTPVSGYYNYGCHQCHNHNNFQGSCSGEPCSGMPVQHMNQSCMGHCNPSKLYTDTYQYLNNNLMQPVVQEVYNDLKTISPANTIMNNQAMNALDTSQGYTNMKNKETINSGHLLNPYNNQGLNLEPNMNNISGDKANMNELGINMGSLSGCRSPLGKHISGDGTGHMNSPGGLGGVSPGMGQNIVNMMMCGQNPNRSEKPMKGGALTQPMVIDAPQSPHGQIGITPVPAQIIPQQKTNIPALPTNPHSENNKENFNEPNLNMSYFPNVEKPVQQMTPNHNVYGQHAHGIAKFNEMFPGVMNNFGGDLNFDPMAIAVQMNPANRQRAAIDTMQKAMSGNNSGINKMLMPSKMEQPSNENTLTDSGEAKLNNSPLQTQLNEGKIIDQEQLNYTYSNEPHQQAYAASGKPTLQHEVQGKDQQFLQQTYQPIEPDANSNAKQQPQHLLSDSRLLSEPVGKLETAQIEKEPIFPANVSQNQVYSHIKRPENYTYNTLGQPIEMLPARSYHIKDLGGPQTLSPQNLPSKSSQDPRLYSNVKSTVSKTSIMGNRTVGKNPSKSQLQHIYNQYKGSQSHTTQNVLSRTEGGSHSEGMLNVSRPRAAQNVSNHQVAIEKVGGDTLPEKEAKIDFANNRVLTNQNGDVGHIDKDQNNAISEHQALPGMVLRCTVIEMLDSSGKVSQFERFQTEIQKPEMACKILFTRRTLLQRLGRSTDTLDRHFQLDYATKHSLENAL